MSIRWEESEHIFCDVQTAARYILRDNPIAAERFVMAVYETFEFIASHPGIGRERSDLGFPQVQSWQVRNFRSYLIFYRQLQDCVQMLRVLHGARNLESELG